MGGAQRQHLAPPIQPLWGQLPAPATIGQDHQAPRQVADRVGDQRVGVGPVCNHALTPGSVGPCGNLKPFFLKDVEDRLDRDTLLALIVDERDDHRLRGSSSPAKKVVAALRTCTCSRNCRFSALSRLISANSSLLTPQR
jgi:hypothetical protein